MAAALSNWPVVSFSFGMVEKAWAPGLEIHHQITTARKFNVARILGKVFV